MVLRPGEAIEWRWGQTDPLKYHGALYTMPTYLGVIYNGLWEYRPDFSQEVCRQGATTVENIRSGSDGLAAEDGQRGTIVWTMNSPYVFVGGRIEADGADAKFFISVDGKTWQAVKDNLDKSFPIVGLDLTLEGENGTLLISSDPTKHIVYLADCTNVTVRRLEMDRDLLVFTQGRIVAMDAAAKTVQVTIDPGYDEPDANYLARLKSFLVFTDPIADTWDHSRWWPSIVTHERLGPLKWRFTLSLTPLTTYAGKRWLLWDNTYKGWGVVVNHSQDFNTSDTEANDKSRSAVF